MPAGGYLDQKPHLSPTRLGVIILAHAAVLGAVALSKTEIVRPYLGPIKLINVPIKVDPPVNEPVQKPKALPQTKTPQAKQAIDKPEPVVTFRPQGGVAQGGTSGPVTGDPGFGQEVVTLPPEPVRIAARIDPRSELQPPYPASEERAANEGSVKVRLLVGADGRVKAVERLSATSDAFWRATEKQALRHWRFKPATVDGRPVESRLVLTVHFQLPA